MEFYLFHLMPWPYLAADFLQQHTSAWVTLSNSQYDPELGASLYHRYLDELELAEELGFDGVCVNEHHQTAYGLMPAPNIIAATLARRTKRLKLVLLGNAIPLRDHPLRVAEEVAMLDVITRGRVVSGFVRGIGCEYFSSNLDPTQSRARFQEAHDLIIKAWTEPGPWQYRGEHYEVRYGNTWPRPFQRPHPPIWLPGQGSAETIDFAARMRYPFINVYEPRAQVKHMLDEYRTAARERHGYEAQPWQLGWMLPIYVADTDEQARREAAEHVLYLFRQLSHRPLELLLPPGYTSPASMRRLFEASQRRQAQASMTLNDLEEAGTVIVGSASTVRERLAQYIEEMGFGKLVPLLQFGTLPSDLTRRNMERFSAEVMPYLRPLHPAA